MRHFVKNFHQLPEPNDCALHAARLILTLNSGLPVVSLVKKLATNKLKVLNALMELPVRLWDFSFEEKGLSCCWARGRQFSHYYYVPSYPMFGEPWGQVIIC